MKAITLRGIDEATYSAIRELSNKAHMSMNKFILNIVEAAVGSAQKPANKEFDKFFGSWKAKDCQAFMKTTKDLRKVDKELWK